MLNGSTNLEDTVRERLKTVKDPEIDSINIVDLGMLENIRVECNDVTVYLLPTFMGCPALDIIKQNVESALMGERAINKVSVQFLNHPPWTSDRISLKGRNQLKEFGIAPPPQKSDLTDGWEVDCPYCDSSYTTIENIFGPTACRSILYCKTCKNPFEALKPVSTLM